MLIIFILPIPHIRITRIKIYIQYIFYKMYMYLYFSVGRIILSFSLRLLVRAPSWEAHRLVGFILDAFRDGILHTGHISLRVGTLLALRVLGTILNVRTGLHIGINLLQDNDLAVSARNKSCIYLGNLVQPMCGFSQATC